MRLDGKRLREIANELDVSVERVRQMIVLAKAQLAYRVFKGVKRPLPRPSWEKNSEALSQARTDRNAAMDPRDRHGGGDDLAGG